MELNEISAVASLKGSRGFELLREELEANRLLDLEHILTLQDDKDILFAVAEARASKRFLSIIDSIIDGANESLDKIKKGEEIEK